MKKILVTGAAGFIGFHTSLALAERGDCVVGLDNYNSYYSVSLKRQRALLLQKKGVEVIEQDLNEKGALQALLDQHPFTHILHLAAQAGVRYAEVNPMAYLDSNVFGFLSLLEMVKSKPHVKLIYASSSSVYGRNERIPFAISDRTDQPANLYAVTKKTNELMASTYHHLYGICAIGLRYFTVYGPWGRPDMAYFSFSKAILEGTPISLFNEGRMRRDFTFIEDIVRGTIAAIDYADQGCELFNLGNCQPVEVLDLVSLLEMKLNKKAKIVFKKRTGGEVETTFADIKESVEKLGFKPCTSLDVGLDRFLAWYTTYQ